MLKLKVTYFLSPEGLSYFPTWYQEVFKETSKQEGFIEMKWENKGKNPVVYLDFTHQEKLDLWASTHTHDKLVAKIEPYFIRAEEVEIREECQSV